MKAFGLELRKTDTVDDLYKSVNNILATAGVPNGSVTQQVQMETVAHALRKMLDTGGYFDVCTIDKCMKVAQIHISKERCDVYHAIHCVHWRDMTADYRQTIIAMVLDDFRDVLNMQKTDLEIK